MEKVIEQHCAIGESIERTKPKKEKERKDNILLKIKKAKELLKNL